MRTGQHARSYILKKETWTRLHSPLGGGAYSPGWVVSTQEWAGGDLLGHLGSNEFWVSQISLAPKKDFAVLIVTNLGDDAAEKPFNELLDALIADHVAHRRLGAR